MKRISATDFKARCLELIDRVHERGETVTITKRGRAMARLVREVDEDDKPWLRLRGKGRFVGDPFAPAVDEGEVEALK
jgi:prevent-host-death family protein